jgi:hypothetical protein
VEESVRGCGKSVAGRRMRSGIEREEARRIETAITIVTEEEDVRTT